MAPGGGEEHPHDIASPEFPEPRYGPGMGILRKIAVVGIAKKLYDESRKPENRRRINEAVATIKERRERSRRPR